MKVSIVIDNYNYEDFIGLAIESALNQTHDDVEVVVVDDGSSDNSAEIIASYGDRVRAIIKENGGQGSALNAGWAAATGDVVAFLDADDTIDATTAARVVSEFEKVPNLARVQWSLRTVDINGIPTGETSHDPRSMPTGDLRDHIVKYRTHVWPSTSGNAYSRSALQRVMPIPDEFSLGCDLYLSETTVVLGPIASLQRAGGSYRKHGSNVWLGKKPDGAYMRQKLHWTEAAHQHVKRLCDEEGIACPADVREALDVAFICQSLASLRLDPENHPYDDTRFGLAKRGYIAALRHPHHRGLHKAKRIVWLTGVAFGPKRVAVALIDFLYAGHKPW
jgi:hypothetical protein